MRGSQMSVFDLDRTLVRGNSSFAFCAYLTARGVLPRLSLVYAVYCYLRHLFFGMSVVELHQKIFHHLLRGRPLALLEQHVEPFVAHYLSRHVNTPVLTQLRLAQHVGHYTLILSNAPHFLVSAFARSLGVDDWRATHYTVDKQKLLSGIASILQGEEKAACVQEAMSKLSLDKKDVTAYSDSYLDLPFLLTAGVPIVVNPDRKLRRFSKAQQWTVL